jgi:hypothetical protein
VTDTLNFTPSGLYEIPQTESSIKETEMELQAYPLSLNCRCGQKVIPRSLMITEENGLMIRTYCPACKDIVWVKFDLQILLASCPRPAVKPLDNTLTLKDRSFLSAMRISLQEGGDSKSHS